MSEKMGSIQPTTSKKTSDIKKAGSKTGSTKTQQQKKKTSKKFPDIMENKKLDSGLTKFDIKRTALTYKASPRIQKLATPKYFGMKTINKPLSTIGAVNPKALTYMPSARIVQLSQPVFRTTKKLF